MHNKYEPVGFVMALPLARDREDSVLVETQAELPPDGTKVYSGQLVNDLVDMLQWYIDTDEVNECDPENEFWTQGKQSAIKLLRRIE